MKSLARNIVFTSIIVMTIVPFAAAQPGTTWFEQWYRAKYGRSSPPEEARLRNIEASTAYRQQGSAEGTAPQIGWFEPWYRAKYGRPSPLEEARIRAEQESTAYRAEAPVAVAPLRNDCFERWYRAKYGRPSPTE